VLVQDSPVIPEEIKVIYFFGVAGVGKNFVADILGEITGIPVYHADTDLTEEIKEAINQKKPFNQEMRDRYFEKISEKIKTKIQEHGRIVVTQATFKEKNRNFLQQEIPGIFFIWVDAPEALVMERLQSRGDKVDPAYGAKIKKDFEEPDEVVPRLVNVGDKSAIIERLSMIFQKYA
jgi:gluconate kinase